MILVCGIQNAIFSFQPPRFFQYMLGKYGKNLSKREYKTTKNFKNVTIQNVEKIKK